MPTVFLCSTIHDFRDLRSALRLWLEEFGYQVLMSEENDFPQSPERNSYESCLGVIDKADYFILLIGNRVGGWFNEKERISITRAEYRYAYERLRQGKLKLLVFVRKEIWDVREDRKALHAYLGKDHAIKAELSEANVAAIANHPSTFANDAQAIFTFIDEVKRTAEMKVGAKGDCELPVANWVYQLTGFKDILDSCKTVLDLSGNLRKKAITASLLHELEANAAQLLTSYDARVFPQSDWSEAASKTFACTRGIASFYDPMELFFLGAFLVHGVNIGKRLRTTALEEAINSGEFLEYEKTSRQHRVGTLHKALCDLLGQIAISRTWDVEPMWLLGNELFQDGKRPIKSERITETNIKMANAMAVHAAFANIVDYTVAIYAAIHGKPFALDGLSLRPLGLEHKSSVGTVIQKSVPYHSAVQWLSQKVNEFKSPNDG